MVKFSHWKKNHFLKYKNFEIISNKESFNFDSFISIHEEKIDIPQEFIKISNPIIISPNTISFKDYIILKYENTKLTKGGLYQLNEKKKNGLKEKINSFGQVEIKLFQEVFFVLPDEDEKPSIKNIFPNHNSYYSAKEVDVKFISNILDVHSKIDYNSIEINLNNKPVYFDYTTWCRDLLRANLYNELGNGENILKILY